MGMSCDACTVCAYARKAKGDTCAHKNVTKATQFVSSQDLQLGQVNLVDGSIDGDARVEAVAAAEGVCGPRRRRIPQPALLALLEPCHSPL